MAERSQEELRLAVISKFGEIQEFEEEKFSGRSCVISGDPESGAFSLQAPSGYFVKERDYAFLGEIDDRKIIARRTRDWSHEDQAETIAGKKATIMYRDGLVECQYLFHPYTEAIVVTLTQVGLGEHATRHAVGVVYLENKLGTVSVALGEGVSDWNNQLIFSVSQEPLDVTTELYFGEDKRSEVVPLDKLFYPPQIYPYGFIVHPEGSNLSFQRLFLGNMDRLLVYQRNWLLTMPLNTDFHKLNTQVKTKGDWAKVHEILPLNLQMLSGNPLP